MMDEQRKHAYRWLLYWAILHIRPLEWLGRRRWQSWSPLYWRRHRRWVQCSGAVADWLHNLALYSSIDFQGFIEERFWRDFERARSSFPEFGPEHYREMFERHTNPSPDGTHDVEPSSANRGGITASPGSQVTEPPR